MILTRATELQAVFDRLGKGSSYGASTTHHEKLWPRIEGGSGGGCPVLTFAITPSLYVDDGEAALAAARAAKAARRRGVSPAQVPLDLGAEVAEPGIRPRAGRLGRGLFGGERARVVGVGVPVRAVVLVGLVAPDGPAAADAAAEELEVGAAASRPR